MDKSPEPKDSSVDSTTAQPSSASFPIKVPADLPRSVLLLAQLVHRGGRLEASRAFAREVGAEDAILFVKDPELALLLPAPAFPQTLPNGSAWQKFLERCIAQGQFRDQLCYSRGDIPDLVSGITAVDGTTALVFIGGNPALEDMSDVQLLLPLLGAAIQGERASALAASEAATAKEALLQANQLSRALDRARGDLQRALHEAQNSQQQLTDLNRNLSREVEDRTSQLRKREEELEQGRKLEAVGRLAGGVSHDFNNLLTGILGLAEELKSALVASDARHEIVEEIIKASHRAFALTRQLLTFAKRQVISPRVLDLNEVITEFNKLLLRMIGEDVRTVIELGEIDRIKIDSGHLEQVLMNLVVNARDAMPQGGSILIRTSNSIFDENDLNATTGARPGRYVKLEITDTGTGMNQQVLSKIFEPFFTTKERGKGTGLGLATVYGIVEQSMGHIHVKSIEGKGTSFTVFFPSAGTALQEHMLSAAVLENAPGHGTILVVEDEDIVRRVILQKLRKQGYTVLEASDGTKGLELSERHQGKIDLVVTDVVMPGMSGREMVKRLTKVCPKISVLYISGYPEDIISQRGILEPGIEFIDKSTLSRDLAAKVKELLHKKRASEYEGS